VEVDRPDQVRVRPDAAGLVGHHCGRVPAVPEPGDDFDELLGPRVPVLVGGVGGQPEVARRPGVPGGHDVPAGPAAGQVVDGGEPAGQVVGGTVGGGCGGDEPDPGGGAGQRGQDLQRVETDLREVPGPEDGQAG